MIFSRQLVVFDVKSITDVSNSFEVVFLLEGWIIEVENMKVLVNRSRNHEGSGYCITLIGLIYRSSGVWQVDPERCLKMLVATPGEALKISRLEGKL